MAGKTKLPRGSLRFLGSAAMTLAAAIALSGLVTAACPYPLGQFAAEGHIQTWNWSGNSTNIEADIVEATLIHGQKAYGEIKNVAGDLKFAYNAEVEWQLPNNEGEAETHSIFLKEYSNETGWDVPIQYMASENTSEERPEGRNVQPSSTAFGDQFWVVWETSGRVRANGSYIMGRSHGPAGFSDLVVFSYAGADCSNKLPKILTFGDKMYIAYQTNAYSTNVSEYVIVGRTFDGTTLGPVELISDSADAWSDQVVSISTDGTRIFAAWASQNMTEFAGEGEWTTKAAVRNPGGHWSAEVDVTLPSKSAVKTPSIAYFSGQAAIVWSSDDPAFDARGDYDIYMRILDPGSLGTSAIFQVTGDDFQQDEINPVAYWWPVAEGGDGMLHILWSSTSSPSGITTSGPDNDIYYRTFNGTDFGRVLLVSDPLDYGFFDVLPGFFTVNGALFAFYLSNICLPGCGHETDWREMTRLLARPVMSHDDVEASYRVDPPTSGSTVTVTVTFTHADGSPATGDGYMVRAPDGTVLPVVLVSGVATVPFAYNASLAHQLDVSYCGALLATTETHSPPQQVVKPSPAGDIVVPALLAAVVLVGLAAWTRSRK